MLTVTVPESVEMFNEETQEFFTLPGYTFDIEHSLVSLSKWEMQWEKPFLGKEKKTDEETFSYVQSMCLTPGIPPEVFSRLSSENLDSISKYIDKKATATWFTERPGTQHTSSEIITSELVYYWMISLTIPFECQYWHLNRLITLIKVCNKKNAPAGKKMSKQELAQRNRQLNEERRARLNTKG